MNKSRSSMLLAVHAVCYSDLNWIQWFRMQFKHMLKLSTQIENVSKKVNY